MTPKAFRSRLVARLHRGLKRSSSPVARFRAAGVEALRICRTHAVRIPDRVLAAFEKDFGDLWKTR